MAEVTFRLSDEEDNVEICVYDNAPPLLKETDIQRLFGLSEFRDCHFYTENTKAIISALPSKPSSDFPIVPYDEPMCFVIGQRRDAILEMEVDEAFLTVTAHYTMQEGGEGISLENIVKKLKSVGAVKGIIKEAIRSLHDRAQRERPGVTFAEILAEGKPAGGGAESAFEYLVVPIQNRVLTPQKREDGTLDMHDLGDIETVSKGDHLMRRIPSQPGENGFTIKGDVLYSAAPDNVPFNVGDGTSTSPEDANLLVATRAGVPLMLDNGLSVSEMLVLKNVDLTTGNVEYDGTVMVSGSVKGGMLVKATKDVIVNGFVESGMVEAGGNIVVQQGVIGREMEDECELDSHHFTSRLIAGNDISAMYAQSAYLEAGRDIAVVTQLLHCHAKSNNGVYVGSKGQKKAKLVGGLIQAGKEVSSGEIGSHSNAQMTIDFSHRVLALEGEYKAKKGEHDVKKELIQGLRDALEELKSQQPTPELIQHCKKIVGTIDIVKAEIVALNLEVESLNFKLNRLRDGIRVTVFGKVFPGVTFVIGDQQHKIIDERGSSIIRFKDDNMVFE